MLFVVGFLEAPAIPVPVSGVSSFRFSRGFSTAGSAEEKVLRALSRGEVVEGVAEEGCPEGKT